MSAATPNRAPLWSAHLARCVQRAQTVPPLPVQGWLTRMVGLTLEALGG